MGLGTGSRENTIGDSLDGHNDPTIFGRVDMIVEHSHMNADIIPTGTAGITVVSNGAAWTLGVFVVVVATNAITDDFDIHWINIEDLSAAGTYELILYSGADASEVEIAHIRTIAEAGGRVSQTGIQTMTPLIPANTQIKAKLMTSNAAGDTMDISIGYHRY